MHWVATKDFSSEIGHDDYFVLYTHLLKQKNGIKKNALMREKLVKLYENINSLFQGIRHGGTGFMHQYSRIPGYAEYSIYLYLDNTADDETVYDITKQKQLYIKSLRQLLADESENDEQITASDKIKRDKELARKINDIDKLITDAFYLRCTQEYHYTHY